MKAFNNLKNKKKSVWSNVFWYVKVCIIWKFVKYTIHWDKTQMLKKNNFRQNKQYKKCPPFYFATSFIFNLQFLYELKQKVRLCKTVCGIFHFQFCFVFIKGCVYYIFASLLFMSKREHLWNEEKCFLFHFKKSFHSWDNQILTFQIFKCHDVIKCLSMNHITHIIE